jgi:hypothetical protein
MPETVLRIGDLCCHAQQNEADMQVEVIYRQPDGSETLLGIKKLDSMPPSGEPFSIEDRQFRAAGYSGPNNEGCYRLFLIDDQQETEH